MKVVVAPGSYKSTLTSVSAAKVIAKAVSHYLPTAAVTTLVLADGGEGTLEVFQAHFGANVRTTSARNPLGREISARVGFLPNDIAIIESAEAVGFSLLRSHEMRPFLASSAGLGELIRFAVDRGARHIYVTMGDSAIMDLGVGMLHALGMKFFDAKGRSLTPTLRNMQEIASFDDSEAHVLRSSSITCLVDTDDFLCGSDGQVQLYGRQKGLGESDIGRVEASYRHFASVIFRKLGVDITTLPRATGSGGVAAALHAFGRAPLLNTLDYLDERLHFTTQIGDADLVVTGEGLLDHQTKFGKVPFFVAKHTRSVCVGIFGSFTSQGLKDLSAVCRNVFPFVMNPKDALYSPEQALWSAATSIFGTVGAASAAR
jgi:glycerate 2-kinase